MPIEIRPSTPHAGGSPTAGTRANQRLALTQLSKAIPLETDARLRRAQELGGALPFEWSARRDHVLASPAYGALFGLKPTDGWSLGTFLACIHPDDRESLRSEHRRLMKAPARFDVTYRVVLPDGSTRWLLSRGESLVDESGTTTGLAGVTMDITARKHAEGTQELLSRELNHRIKNLFAVMASIVTLSARGNSSLVAFGLTIRGRIEALAKAHDLAQHDEDDMVLSSLPSLRALLETLLAPYRPAENQPNAVLITGDDVALGPHATTAFALAFHELATNAAKYGALSNRHGKLLLTCTLSEDSLEIIWTERGGPPLPGAPRTEGFGSLLTRRSLVQNLGGEMWMDWQPEGLSMQITLPRESLER